MHLKISSAKWRPFCPRGDELRLASCFLSCDCLHRLGCCVGLNVGKPINVRPLIFAHRSSYQKCYVSVTAPDTGWPAAEVKFPRYQGSWGQHVAHLGTTGPIWASFWPHEPCYPGPLVPLKHRRPSLRNLNPTNMLSPTHQTLPVGTQGIIPPPYWHSTIVLSGIPENNWKLSAAIHIGKKAHQYNYVYSQYKDYLQEFTSPENEWKIH